MSVAPAAPKRNASLLRLHAPLAVNALGLAVRIYAAWIWARFAADKIEHGWLTTNALRPVLQLVADGHLPAAMPGYDALVRSALAWGLDAPGSRLLPVLEMAIAVGLLAGTRVRLIALVATFVNLNLLLAGIGSMALDGRLIVLQLLLVGVARASHPSWTDLTDLVRRIRRGAPMHPRCAAGE
jgi:hypothetical protein